MNTVDEQSLKIKQLHNYLYSYDDFIKISKALFEGLTVEEAILYQYLVDEAVKKQSKGDYKFMHYDIGYFFDVSTIKKELNLSRYQQASILNSLQKKHLLSVGLGQSRQRYIIFNYNPPINSLRNKGKRIKQIKELNRLLNSKSDSEINSLIESLKES